MIGNVSLHLCIPNYPYFPSVTTRLGIGREMESTFLKDT